MKKIEQIKFEFEGFDYDATVIFTLEKDPNWGADADGNRGVEKVICKSVDILDVSICGNPAELGSGAGSLGSYLNMIIEQIDIDSMYEMN